MLFELQLPDKAVNKTYLTEVIEKHYVSMVVAERNSPSLRHVHPAPRGCAGVLAVV